MSKRSFLRYESKKERLISRRHFVKRLARNFAAASLLIGVSLLGGMAGYRFFEGMEWIDAFANASMILSGMGPLAPLETWGGKLFAGFYALYSGLVVIVATAIILAPVGHRMLHQFHLEDENKQYAFSHNDSSLAHLKGDRTHGRYPRKGPRHRKESDRRDHRRNEASSPKSEGSCRSRTG